eukprot:scaffold270_cov347-Pavlova_lutheri.AAC.2
MLGSRNKPVLGGGMHSRSRQGKSLYSSQVRGPLEGPKPIAVQGGTFISMGRLVVTWPCRPHRTLARQAST